MNTFESQVRQTSPKNLKLPREHRTRKSGDDLRYISTPKAAVVDGDYGQYSGLSPESDSKPVACKWWGSRNDKAGSAQEHGDPRISSQNIAKTDHHRSSMDAELPISGHKNSQTLTASHRSHQSCDWQNTADIVAKGVQDLRAYLSYKFSSLSPTLDDIGKYTHMVSYQFAELAANLKPNLIVLDNHDDQCVWVPKCSWRCGEAYMTMAGVTAYLIETQMLSNACVLKLHKSLKSKKSQLLQQSDIVRHMEHQVEELRQQIDAISAAAKKQSEGQHEITSLETMVHSHDMSTGEKDCFWSEYEAEDVDADKVCATPVCKSPVSQSGICHCPHGAPNPPEKGYFTAAPVSPGAVNLVHLLMAFGIGLILGGLFFSDVVGVILDKIIELTEPPQFKYLCERKKY